MAESGGEDALLPRVLLGMMQAQEDTNKRMEELHAQSAELVKVIGENAETVRAQFAKAGDNTAAANKALTSQIAELQKSTRQEVKQIGESADSSRKESAAALARLDKKASWDIGLVATILAIALAAVALVVWEIFA